MAEKSNYYKFDTFVERLEEAILLAQKTAFLADQSENKQLRQLAGRSLKNIRAALQIVDEPLIWFRMEKGANYVCDSDGKWQCINPKKPKKIQM